MLMIHNLLLRKGIFSIWKEMSDKKEPDYLKLIKQLEIRPEDFLMLGNSMKSDIYPLRLRIFHWSWYYYPVV